MAVQRSFVNIMAFCHMLPGPEALQLAIYVGDLKCRLVGGILAGVTFIVPGTAVMILLNWLYVKYGKLPQVNNALFALKPAVLGIIAAGVIKLARAAIRNRFLAALLVGAFAGMRFGGVNFLAFVLGGAHYVEKVRDTETIQAFLAGVSAAVVAVIVLSSR